MRHLRFYALPTLLGFLVTLTACNKTQPQSQARESKTIAPQKNDSTDINNLNIEVSALEMLNQLKLTRPQLERLAKLAPMTARKALPSRSIKVSEDYQKTLKDLRAALIDEDEERIADLTLALDELRDKENFP